MQYRGQVLREAQLASAAEHHQRLLQAAQQFFLPGDQLRAADSAAAGAPQHSDGHHLHRAHLLCGRLCSRRQQVRCTLKDPPTKLMASSFPCSSRQHDVASSMPGYQAGLRPDAGRCTPLPSSLKVEEDAHGYLSHHAVVKLQTCADVLVSVKCSLDCCSLPGRWLVDVRQHLCWCCIPVCKSEPQFCPLGICDRKELPVQAL